jgi:hypothetical protein
MLNRRLFWLVCWGIAFAYIEASIVVYLRKLYYPAGFSFPVVLIEPDTAAVELVREVVTLGFMWAVAELTYRSFQCRLAVFMFLFGVWDIFYYVFLKVILNWPASLAEWDILFLVPLPWVGPVWAPVAVSTGMIWAGVVILARNEQERPLDLNRRFMLLEVAAGFTIIVSFLIPGRAVIDQTIPEHFPWYLFLIGLGSGLGAFGWKLRFTEKEEII